MTTHDANSTPGQPTAGTATAAAVLQRLIDLEEALHRHLPAEALPTFEALDALTRRMQELSVALPNLPPAAAAELLDRARRIRPLYDQLTLRMTQQRKETAAKLAQMRTGKATLRAYGQNT